MVYLTLAQLVEDAKKDLAIRSRESTMQLDQTIKNLQRPLIFREISIPRLWGEIVSRLHTKKETPAVSQDTSNEVVLYLKSKLNDARNHYIGTHALLTLGLEKLAKRAEEIPKAKNEMAPTDASLEELKKSIKELTAFKAQLTNFFDAVENQLNKLKILFNSLSFRGDKLAESLIIRDANEFFRLMEQLEESSGEIGFMTNAVAPKEPKFVRQADLDALSQTLAEAIVIFPVVD